MAGEEYASGSERIPRESLFRSTEADSRAPGLLCSPVKRDRL